MSEITESGTVLQTRIGNDDDDNNNTDIMKSGTVVNSDRPVVEHHNNRTYLVVKCARGTIRVYGTDRETPEWMNNSREYLSFESASVNRVDEYLFNVELATPLSIDAARKSAELLQELQRTHASRFALPGVVALRISTHELDNKGRAHLCPEISPLVLVVEVVHKEGNWLCLERLGDRVKVLDVDLKIVVRQSPYSSSFTQAQLAGKLDVKCGGLLHVKINEHKSFGTLGAVVKKLDGFPRILTAAHVLNPRLFSGKGSTSVGHVDAQFEYLIDDATNESIYTAIRAATNSEHLDVLERPVMANPPDTKHIKFLSDACCFRYDNTDAVAGLLIDQADVDDVVNLAKSDTETTPDFNALQTINVNADFGPIKTLQHDSHVSVFKCGAASAITHGVFKGRRNLLLHEWPLAVSNDDRRFSFEECYIVQRGALQTTFAVGGDSGSLVWCINSDGVVSPVGLISAMLPSCGGALVAPIEPILKAFGVEFWTMADAKRISELL